MTTAMATTGVQGACERHYHFEVGFPEGFDISKYTRILPDTLKGTTHYNDRREAKRLPREVSKEWVLGATPITLTRDEDRNLVRYAMRGQWSNGRDLTVVIDAGSGYLVTGWYNNEDDWHRITKVAYSAPGSV